MSTLLFSPDSEFGHVVENSPQGVIYRDDGSLVDPLNLRPCLGCKLKVNHGDQDPCIANLPGTSQACCGHGLALSPREQKPNGYVALNDGRTFRFLGTVGGDAIRAAVDCALRKETLPEGFTYDVQRMWWDGLSEEDVAYVRERITRALAELVTEAQGGEPPSAAFLAGEAMWYEGLDQDKKDFVIARLPGKLQELIQEAVSRVPTTEPTENTEPSE